MRTSARLRPTRSGRRALIVLLTGAGLVLTPLTAQASAGSTAPSVAAPASVVAPTAASQTAVNTALAQQGDPYAWGGSGPNAFDCSGLVQFAYRSAGITLPRASRLQATVGTPVAKANLRPGDLVFFYSPISHVGIYIGNGLMVHAPSSGSVVKVVSVNAMPGYNTARRVG